MFKKCFDAARSHTLVWGFLYLRHMIVFNNVLDTRIIQAFEEKCLYNTRIFVILSYFLWFKAPSMRCELLEPVQSYGNKSAMWGVEFTHLFKNKNFNFVRIFALFCLYFCRILLTFCLKKCSYFQQKKGLVWRIGHTAQCTWPPLPPLKRLILAR